MSCSILIKNLAVPVKLGVGKQERATPQEILIDLKITFPTLLKGCINDEIQDTLCYDTLSREIVNLCAQGDFKLIEFLAHEILKLVKKMLPTHLVKPQKVNVIIYKKPPVQNLKDYVSFSLSD